MYGHFCNHQFITEILKLPLVFNDLFLSGQRSLFLGELYCVFFSSQEFSWALNVLPLSHNDCDICIHISHTKCTNCYGPEMVIIKGMMIIIIKVIGVIITLIIVTGLQKVKKKAIHNPCLQLWLLSAQNRHLNRKKLRQVFKQNSR